MASSSSGDPPSDAAAGAGKTPDSVPNPTPAFSKLWIDGEEYKIIREGLAEILEPYNAVKQVKKTSTGGVEQSVFYNPIQQYNRDLSVLAIRVFAEEMVASKGVQRLKTITKRSRKKKWQKENAAAAASASTAAEQPINGENVPEVAMEEGSGTKRKRDDVSANLSQVDHEAKKTKTGEEQARIAQSASPKASKAVDQTATSVTSSDDGSTNKKPANGSHNKVAGSDRTEFRVLDALSATGLRALRYTKEIPEVTCVVANDLSPEAVESIRRHIKHNGVGKSVRANQSNACNHMYNVATNNQFKVAGEWAHRYDVIDLDPYGAASPFIDSAVQALSDGGMLCVTCTDSSIFASVGYMEKTFAQYGGTPWKGILSHEAGLRLITHAVATSAARHGLAIEPLLSLSIDYYVRIFIRVRKSANEVKLLAGKTMLVYNCDTGCHSWTRQLLIRNQKRLNKQGEEICQFKASQGPTASPNCEHCGFKMHIVGPMWGGPLHNPFFVQRMLDKLPDMDATVYQTLPRLEGMLTTALHETLLPPNVSHVKRKDGVNGKATQNGKEKSDTAASTVELSKKDSNEEANKHTAETSTTKRQEDTIMQSGMPPPTEPQTDRITEAGSATQDESKQSDTTINSKYTPMERLDPAFPDAHPFFFVPSDLAGIIHCQCPSDAAIRGALMHLGYRVTRSHVKAGSIRTDAPYSVIWDVMRAWVRQRAPTKVGAIKENTAGWGIWQRDNQAGRTRVDALKKVEEGLRELLAAGNNTGQVDIKLSATMSMIEAMTRKEEEQNNGAGEAGSPEEDGKGGIEADKGKDQDKKPLTITMSSTGEKKKIVFDEFLGRDPDKKKLVRYQVNPRENWGPQTRAK